MIHPLPSAGLCNACLHAKPIRSSRGSTFIQCLLSFTDPRFERYPTLPVLACAGYRSIAREDESGED